MREINFIWIFFILFLHPFDFNENTKILLLINEEFVLFILIFTYLLNWLLIVSSITKYSYSSFYLQKICICIMQLRKSSNCVLFSSWYWCYFCMIFEMNYFIWIIIKSFSSYNQLIPWKRFDNSFIFEWISTTKIHFNFFFLIFVYSLQWYERD